MIDLYIGCTWPIGFGPIPDAISGGTVDLTGATVVCEARLKGTTGSDVAATGSVDEGGQTARAEFSATQTAGFTPDGTYIIDAYAVLADGRKPALCKPFSVQAKRLVSAS